MTKSTILGTVVGTIAGATAGVVISPLMVVGNMAWDATAPISYPVLGLVGGAFGTLLHEDNNSKVACLAGSLLGLTMAVPFAPANFCHRPFTTPVVYTMACAAIGGGLGYLVSEELQKK